MSNLRTFFLAKSAAALIFCGGTITSRQGNAAELGEPAEAFVAQLRSAGYFDTALKYLDRIDKYPGVPQSFIEAIPLERSQTFIDAAVSARNISERDKFFVSAEEALKGFLTKTDHPRISEARLQLGKLQMVRADQLMSVADPDDQARENARKSFLDAAETFNLIVTDLRSKLESMRGQKIDAEKEPEKAAQREQFRFEFLQAQLRAGEAKQLAANTYREPLKDGKKLLEEALVSFTELSEKYGGYFQGAMSMLYRAQAQRTLGDTKSAIDSFQRVLEQPEVDLLRPARMLAMTGLIEMQLAESQPKLDEVIGQSKRLVDAARPNERRVPEFAALQVALAKAYLFQSQELIAAGKQIEGRKVASTNARPLLNAAVKVPGLHESEARQLLSKMGIEKSESTEPALNVEQPKSLEEALSIAQQLMLEGEDLNRTRDTLAEQVAAGGEGAEAAAAELEATDAQIDEGRRTLIQVVRGGLAIGGSESVPLNQARQYLASALYQRGDYWDAAAVGQFLSHSAANKPEGLRGGLMAILSLKSLIQSLPKESTTSLVSRIEVLGEHLSKTWPDDPQASAAKGILVSLALDDDRWDDARKLLTEMPEGAERASFHRLMGQLLWNKSLMLRQENKVAEGEAVLPQAASDLRTGLDSMPGELVGPEALQAALVLARIEMRRGDAAGALKALDNAKYGPLKGVEKLGEPRDGFSSDLYAVELQAVVGAMTSEGSDTATLTTRAISTMERLEASVKGKPDADERLVRIYIALARDIKDQLDAASSEQKTKLINAFQVILDAIAKSSKDPATLQWVGQTLMQMGEAALADKNPAANQKGPALLASAIQTFETLQGKLGDKTPATLKFQLGRANRLAGEYKKAIDLFEEILKASPTMLDTQVEAALAYEQWAGTINPQFAASAYRAALSGARPGADKKNVIWGWGRISKMVSGRPEYRERFFEARYRVAFNRFMMGKANNDTKLMEQASKDITQVNALYPDMGGPDRRKDFDLLMKEIQKGLGINPAGLP
jgi:tetratricopeptide (TPR) repeat protein